ncbi:MAG: hypothetical protein JRI23_15030 [Deltaproteobacteria bacterium]|nr:hypothetical protein [Deltaproteobacteria bacterium]MBW2533064.1 hypothetical protein [Deltaproteobacteria bacterium]
MLKIHYMQESSGASSAISILLARSGITALWEPVDGSHLSLRWPVGGRRETLQIRIMDSHSRWMVWSVERMLADTGFQLDCRFLAQADAIVIVTRRFVRNCSHFVDRLRATFDHIGRLPREVPVVFQVSLMEDPDGEPFEAYRGALDWPICDHVQAHANGDGVIDALNRAIELVKAR